MLAIDTDIVVRYLANDHETLSARALKLVSENAVFVPASVVLETEWVLRDAYETPRERVIEQLRKFCGLERVTVGNAESVARALAYAEGGLDLADALHLAQSQGCEAFATFDKKLAKRARNVETVEVRLA
jgi:predicted nucleic-acid-binding protein